VTLPFISEFFLCVYVQILAMVSDQVHVITRATLNCANEATVAAVGSPFSLGPMDHIVPSILPIEAILVYRKPTSSPDKDFFPLHRLKQAVAHLLDYYPHLTGRLQINPSNNVPEIAHLGTGADIWEARCGRKLRNIASSSLSGRIIVPHLPGGGGELLPIFYSTVGSISHNAIFAIQHTRFACGGISLGIRVHHLVCDANGFFQLIRDLAEIYRQLRDSSPPTLIFPPEIRSHFRVLNLSSNENSKALAVRPSDYYLQKNLKVGTTTYENGPDTADTERPTISARLLRFSGEELAVLKQAATNRDPKSGTWVSTFEALAAYLYQRVYQARMEVLESRGISPHEPQFQALRAFATTMDMRDASRLKLPPRYFPNAVHIISTYSSHNNLMKGPIWYIAKTIHYAIRSVDMDHVKKDFEWIAAQPEKSQIRETKPFVRGGLAVIQWTREDTYIGVDFEVRENGRPVPPSLVSPPFSGSYLMDGLAMVIPTEEKLRKLKIGTWTESDIPCAVDVNLALNDQLWPILQQDMQFLSHIC
jgi:hypothetical protein